MKIFSIKIKAGVLEKSGSWYAYGQERIGQGRESVREFLLKNPDKSRIIEKAIFAELSGKVALLEEALAQDPLPTAEVELPITPGETGSFSES